MLRKLIFYDPLPRPRSGKCPVCHHENGGGFGHFHCEDCGEFVFDDALDNNIWHAGWKSWALRIIGGIALGLLLVGVSIFFDQILGL